ncbi:MAG: PEP-CTERM sorting domain-containing protein, partial [Candidatus Saccharimonadales bacterium]
LMVLTGTTTHADPNATGAAPWPATGYNQSGDIMQPALFAGATLSATDGNLLDDAFGWKTLGLTINLVNDNPGLINGQALADIEAGITAVQNLFNVSQPGPPEPNFTWTIVPEPSTLGILVLVASAALLRQRRAA